MNRTGLFIALGLALVIGLLFGIYPELDLKLAGLFYDAATRRFRSSSIRWRRFARDGCDVDRMGTGGAGDRCAGGEAGAAGPAAADIGARDRVPARHPPLSAGVLTNLTFKSYWGRPRPVVVTQFNGPDQFVAWWDPRGACARNCSFFSGEGATAFWTFAPAALTPPAWRPLAYAAATAFGVMTSLLRMAFGGHFFTDVAIAGLVTFLVIWLAYAYIYRWPSDPAHRRGRRCRADEIDLAGLSLAPEAVRPWGEPPALLRQPDHRSPSRRMSAGGRRCP